MVCCHEDDVTRFRWGPPSVGTTIRVPRRPDLRGSNERRSGREDGRRAGRLQPRFADGPGRDSSRWNDATGRADAHLGAAIASALTCRPADRAGRRRPGPRGPPRALPRRVRTARSRRRVRAGRRRPDLLGGICDESQRLASTLLRNQVPETDRLAALARSLGAHASSAFGPSRLRRRRVGAHGRGRGSDFAADWLARLPGRVPPARAGPARRWCRDRRGPGEIVA